MHGSNRLGGNSLSDLLVFGKRAGEPAGLRAKRRRRPTDGRRDEVEAAVERRWHRCSATTGGSPYAFRQTCRR